MVSIVIDADTLRIQVINYTQILKELKTYETIFRNDISSDYFNSWNNFIFDLMITALFQFLLMMILCLIQIQEFLITPMSQVLQ